MNPVQAASRARPSRRAPRRGSVLGEGESENRQVLAVLLERAGRDEADRACAGRLVRLESVRWWAGAPQASAEIAVTGPSSIACRLCSVRGGRKTMSPGRAMRPVPVLERLTESVPDST